MEVYYTCAWRNPDAGDLSFEINSEAFKPKGHAHPGEGVPSLGAKCVQNAWHLVHDQIKKGTRKSGLMMEAVKPVNDNCELGLENPAKVWKGPSSVAFQEEPPIVNRELNRACSFKAVDIFIRYVGAWVFKEHIEEMPNRLPC